MKQLDADVVALNEMDIGMARTGQQHTARLLVHCLEMNYAWAIEFVELPRGNKNEQKSTEGLEDDMGLHGNAILSRCKFHDPKVIREDDISPYFTDKSSFINAYGFEKRLGGRIILLTRLEYNPDAVGSSNQSSSHDLVVGSTHTLKQDKHYSNQITQYI